MEARVTNRRYTRIHALSGTLKHAIENVMDRCEAGGKRSVTSGCEDVN